MKKGDYIRVKDGTKDPDFKGNYLSVYTGYIEGVDDYSQVCILWDESTLMKFDHKFIEKCDRKNLDHTRIVLSSNDIELIEK